MLRYVLLRHECPATYRDGPHWDLMLEENRVLRTWSLLALPAAWGGGAAPGAVAADALPEHRIDYLDYQGPLSGDRGSVTRVAAGEYRATTPAAGAGGLDVVATGGLAGRWRLLPVGGPRWWLVVE